MGQQPSKPERRLQKLQAMLDHARSLLDTWQERALADQRAGVAPGTPGSALAVYIAALEHYEQAVAEERALMAHLGMWRHVGLLVLPGEQIFQPACVVGRKHAALSAALS